jgi:hypothetical protein
MRASAIATGAYSGHEAHEPIRVWIESADGAIARGTVDVLSADEAVVRLADGEWLSAGWDVAVRLATSRTAPTLAARARVTRVRPTEASSAVCEIAWTHAGADREQLAMLVASLS